MSLTLRPAVARFAQAMERALRRHDAMKGEDSWKDCIPQDILWKLHEEVSELDVACRRPNPSKTRMQAEAADVGNMAMMIFDCEDDR